MFGGIAQLGERLNGIQEVSGSIPLISTTKSSENFGFQNFLFVYAGKMFDFPLYFIRSNVLVPSVELG